MLAKIWSMASKRRESSLARAKALAASSLTSLMLPVQPSVMLPICSFKSSSCLEIPLVWPSPLMAFSRAWTRFIRSTTHCRLEMVPFKSLLAPKSWSRRLLALLAADKALSAVVLAEFSALVMVPLVMGSQSPTCFWRSSMSPVMSFTSFACWMISSRIWVFMLPNSSLS